METMAGDTVGKGEAKGLPRKGVREMVRIKRASSASNGRVNSGVVVGDDANEVMGYLDALDERLPRFARRAAAIPANEPYSVEWFAQLGKFLKQARQDSGLSRPEAAAAAEVDPNVLRFVEVGMGEPEDLRVLPRYARVLNGNGDEVLKECKRLFGVP